MIHASLPLSRGNDPLTSFQAADSAKAKKAKFNEIPVSQLFEIMDADFKSGKLTWKATNQKGKEIGRLTKKGYLFFSHAGMKLMSHRVIYAMYWGEWPEDQIDHINGEKLDNRIENLRVVNTSENQSNHFSPRANNKAGCRGVTLMSGYAHKKYRAEITKNGRKHSLGYFATPEEASLAYLSAKMKLHPEAFCRFSTSQELKVV